MSKNENWIPYKRDSLPEANVPLIIKDAEGQETKFCYRCGHTTLCTEIRSELGGGLLIVPTHWKYDRTNEFTSAIKP